MRTWHRAHKHMENNMKHVESIDPNAQACGSIDIGIGIETCV